MISQSQRKMRAARWSVTTAVGLAALKLVAGLATGSLAVLSSAVDSLLDIFMSGINFIAIRKAEEPADRAHPFGHGKYETLATVIQSTVVASSGLWIIVESVQRLREGAAPGRLEGGMAVLALSALASWFIARHLKKVGRETDSSALQADSLHFAMDLYTNLVLLVGLAAIQVFDLPWLDPVLSLVVALYILFEAARLLRLSLRDILDEELPASIKKEITRVIEAHGDLHLDFHNLRTRRAGSQKIMDFHLTVCSHLTVAEAHLIADHLEKRIEEEIPGSDVTIHIEPCPSCACPENRKECADLDRLLQQLESSHTH